MKVDIIYLTKTSTKPLFDRTESEIDQRFIEWAENNEQIEHVGDYRTNVFAEALNAARSTYGMNFVSNGSFHYIVRYKESIWRGSCQFLMRTLSSVMVGSLTLNVNSHEHNRNLATYSIERTVASLRALLTTGAMGGYSLNRIIDFFSRVQFTFICSRGGLSDIQNSELGAQLYKWTVGPFDLQDLLNADEKVILNIIAERMRNKVEEMREFGVSEGSDNSDIDNYDRDILAAKDNPSDLLAYRTMLFQRRMDEVVVKFLPRNFTNNIGLIIRPVNYATPAINLESLNDIQIPLLSDTKPIRLHNKYNERDDNGQYEALVNDAITLEQAYNDEIDMDLLQYDAPNSLKSLQKTHNRNSVQIMEGGYSVRKQMANTLNNPSTANNSNLSKLQTNVSVKLTNVGINNEDVHDIFFQPLPANEFQGPNDDVGLYEVDIGDIEVGCLISAKDRIDAYFLRLGNFWEPPNVDDNDCFLRCLFEATKQNPSAETFSNIRKNLALSRNEHFNIECLGPLARERNEVYHIWNIVKPVYDSINEINPNKISQMFKKKTTIEPFVDQEDKKKRSHIHFLWYKNHCYLIKDPSFIVDKVKCGKCTQWIKNSTFNVHQEKCFYCTICRKSYTNKNLEHSCGGPRLLPKENVTLNRSLGSEKVCEDWVPTRKFVRVKKMTPQNKIWLADIETFPNPHEGFNCCAYAIGIQCLEKGSKYHAFWGKDCLKDFLGN